MNHRNYQDNLLFLLIFISSRRPGLPGLFLHNLGNSEGQSRKCPSA